MSKRRANAGARDSDEHRPEKGHGRALAYDWLKQRIVSLAMAPGSSIDEAALVEMLGVSRTPLREAMVRLAAEGLVELLPNRGARVSGMDLTQLQEHLDAFELMQRAATTLAARHRPDAAIPGGLAVAVPMELPGMHSVHRRHGALPWSDVVAPVVPVAAKGFPAHPYLVAALGNVNQSAVLGAFPAFRDAFFVREGGGWRAPRVNETCCARPAPSHPRRPPRARRSRCPRSCSGCATRAAAFSPSSLSASSRSMAAAAPPVPRARPAAASASRSAASWPRRTAAPSR